MNRVGRIAALFMIAAGALGYAEPPRFTLPVQDLRHLVPVTLNPGSGLTEGGVAYIATDPGSGQRKVFAQGRDSAGTWTPFAELDYPDAVYVGRFRGYSPTWDNLVVASQAGAGQPTCIENLHPEPLGGYGQMPVACGSYGDFTGGNSHVITAFQANVGDPGESVAVAFASTIVMFRATPGGGLSSSPETYPLPAGFNSVAIGAGDANGDGKSELFVLGQAGELKVLANNSAFVNAISFSEMQSLTTAAKDIQVADVDRSGGATAADIVAVGDAELRVFRNGGGSTPFGVGTSEAYALPTGCRNVAVADTPGDNAPEVWINNPAVGFIFEFTNDGSGRYGIAPSGVYEAASHFQVEALNYEFAVGGSTGAITVWPMGQGSLAPADDYLIGGGPDPGLSPVVRVILSDGTVVPVSWQPAYGASMGVRIGRGNLDNVFTLHARDDILTGPERGAVYGPQVRGWRRDQWTIVALAKINFYAYGTLRYGVGVEGGNVDGDAFDEIITAPGPGAVFGPHVRGFNYDGAALAAMSKINSFVYGTLKWGANATAGSLDSDGFDEIVTAPGPGAMFSAQVRGFNVDGASMTSIGKINFVAFGNSSFGATVAVGDVDADGLGEIAVGRGAGASQGADFAGFDYDGAAVAAVPGFTATPFATSYGGRVALGDVAGGLSDTAAELVCGAGPDPVADGTVKSFGYDGTNLNPGLTFTGIVGSSYGTNVATGNLSF